MFVLMLVRIGCSKARKKARSFVATLRDCREFPKSGQEHAWATYDDSQGFGDLHEVSRCFDSAAGLDGL